MKCNKYIAVKLNEQNQKCAFCSKINGIAPNLNSHSIPISINGNCHKNILPIGKERELKLDAIPFIFRSEDHTRVVPIDDQFQYSLKRNCYTIKS